MIAAVGLCLVFFFGTCYAAENETLSLQQTFVYDVDTIDLDTVTCPTIRCAPIGSPVCARRKGRLVLFPTNCALLAFNCVSGQRWKGVKLETCAKKICPVRCNSCQKTPVCATNGKKVKTFESECKFRNFACKRYDKKWSRALSC